MNNKNITLKIIHNFLQGLDKKFDLLDNRVGKIENRLDTIDTKINSMDIRINSMDSRFNSIDKKFNSIDKRFDSLENKSVSFEQRFDSLEKTMKMGFEKVNTDIEDLAIIVGKETLDIRNRIDELDEKFEKRFDDLGVYTLRKAY